MGGFGFGFGSVAASRHFANLGVDSQFPSLAPSQQWDGQPGSGFAIVPLDPVRTTAKPALRLLTPPNQYFRKELVVGVIAGANNGGDLDNLGLEKVVVHYEGSTQEILSPSFFLFEDANGKICKYLGWWTALRNDHRYGHGHVYFEAVPKDPTMQNRIMGPYQFSPENTRHDYEIEVAPSPVEIAGVRYQTVAGALAYLKAQSAEHPLITITESGDQLLPVAGPTYEGSGYCTITATVPVSFVGPAFTTDGSAQLRPRYNRLHLKGDNITIDFARVLQFWSEVPSGLTGQHWFDGIKITDSNTRDSLWRGGSRSIPTKFREHPYFTECTVDGLNSPCVGASLVRGGMFSLGYGDIFTDVRAIVGVTVDDWDSLFLNQETDIFSVTYVGAEATATLERAGGVDPSSTTYTAKWGGNEDSFTVGRAEALYTGGTHYWPADVVNWLNGLTDWSATLLDNSRRASSGSLPSGKGQGFSAQDVKGAPLTIVSYFDMHGDWYQHRFNAEAENRCMVDCVATNLVTQDIFIAGNTVPSDWILYNLSFHQRDTSGRPFDKNLKSQLGRTAMSHVVLANISWANQELALRPSQNYAPDTYCLITNCTAPVISWDASADPNLTIANNHLHAGAIAPEGSIGTTIGGDETNLFADVAAGDFTPAGALAGNLKPRILLHDKAGNQRSDPAPAGALA